MRTYARSRHVVGAAAAALALALGACGSGDSSGSSEEDGSSSQDTSSKASSGSDSSAGDDAAGANSATVDGTKVRIDDSWRAICARSPNGKVGSAVLMENVSLDQLKENPESETGFITTHFDIAGDKATVKNVSITRPSDRDADPVSYSSANSEGDTTMTMTEESVRVEGEGEQTNPDGTRREGIPFTIDVACTDWKDLTNEGDVQQP